MCCLLYNLDQQKTLYSPSLSILFNVLIFLLVVIPGFVAQNLSVPLTLSTFQRGCFCEKEVFLSSFGENFFSWKYFWKMLGSAVYGICQMWVDFFYYICIAKMKLLNWNVAKGILCCFDSVTYDLICPLTGRPTEIPEKDVYLNEAR